VLSRLWILPHLSQWPPAARQAWSADMLESVRGAGTRMLLRAQHYFFFPILLFARISWCQQGVAHAIDMTTKVRSVL